jgi:hypothetical protein|tara:strand:+ start:703 stop:2412 length:1710 start_codon:yes stop_codon:yes gene_type:complete
MLGAYPLNSVPLNGLAVSGSNVQPIEQSGSFAWRLQVLLGGVDVTEVLTGSVVISRSEDGDAVARFGLYLGPGPVDVVSYSGAALTVDFVVLGNPDHASRRFTGYLVQPSFDVLSRVMLCEATTRLADTIERMELAEIDLLTGGYWSADVFEETAGRSRWDYAQERMSTRPASLNVDRNGQPRVTSWQPALAYEFGAGTSVYESVDVNLAPLSDTPNVYELELDYRFSRYRQRNQAYSWLHPGTGGNTSITGFNAWRADSTELPDVQMITEATESAGWYLRSANWFRLYGDMPDLPQPWYNDNTDLLLGADWWASIRWSQRAVEQYRVRLQVGASVAAVGEVIERARVVLDTDSSGDQAWDQSTGTGGVVAGDAPVNNGTSRDAGRLAEAAVCALHQGRTALLAGHRANQVTWQTPLAHALAVDFGQGIRASDGQVLVTGVPAALEEEMDITTGLAMLTITLAVSAGKPGAVDDELALPAPPEFEDDAGPIMSGALPTQLGLKASSPLYDDEMPGFAGNYSIGNGDPSLRFPRRFMLITPEIPEQWRDEIQAEQPAIYSVAPRADTLEL